MQFLSRAVLAYVFLNLALFSSAQELHRSPQRDDVFRVNVNLVQVEAQVLEKKTRRPRGFAQ